MNEEIAALTRLSVEITLLATMSSTVVVMFVTGMAILGNFTSSVSSTPGRLQQDTLYQASGEVISAPGCFRICDSNINIFNKIKISMLDGSSYTDINVLLQANNEIKQFRFEAVRMADASWNLELKEVE